MNWKDLSAIRETLKEVKDPQMGSVLSSVVDAISGIRNLVMHTLGAKISIVTKDIPDVKNSTFLHVVAGDNDWIPGPDDLKELSELFHEVTDSPVIVTPTGISASFADFGLPPEKRHAIFRKK